MPRKTRRPPVVSPISRRPVWPGYALTALVSLLLGVGVTLAVVRHNSPAPAPAPAIPVPSVVPPADLTLGLASAPASRKLGDWFFDHREWQKCVTAYEEAVKGGSDDANIRTDLGTAYRALGQPQRALEEYVTAQKLDKRHENSLFNQGIVYAADLGDKARASKVWQDYLTRFPQGQHVKEARDLLAQLGKA